MAAQRSERQKSKPSTTERYKVRAASGSGTVVKRAQRAVANYTKSVQRAASKPRKANTALNDALRSCLFE